MKRAVTHVMLSVFVAVAFALAGCGGGNSGTSNASTSGDIISINSISPTSSVANQVTSFAIEVSYSLTSKDSGLLMVGFNTDQIDSFTMIPSQEFTVPKGSGTHTFNVTTTPVNWGSAGSFKAYVNLSENPHPSTWTALANNSITIPISASTAKALMSIDAPSQCDKDVCY